MDDRSRIGPVPFEAALGALLVAGLALRVVYVVIDQGTEPTFALPIEDGAYYLDWARALARDVGTAPEGAYYLAPLYAWALAGLLRVVHEPFAPLYLLQQTLSVASAGALGLIARRLHSAPAGLAAACCFLGYHALLFFAARPMGETLAIFLAVVGMLAATSTRREASASAGAALGLACLARPNLLLLAPVWAAAAPPGNGAAASGRLGRRWARAALLLAGLLGVVLPVTVRNVVVSGHLVPISSNAGITLLHGNGPAARGIGERHGLDLSGRVATQRDEVMRLARAATGDDLDAVEADGWARGRAVAARLADPVGTVRLLLRRAMLTLADEEISIDYAPALDRNPLRWSAPIPFAVILGLAAAGGLTLGWRRSGGALVWGSVLACAAAPVLFYVNVRYRLPMAALLCLPAGLGLTTCLVDPDRRRRGFACLATVAVAAASFAMPTFGLAQESRASALANRASAWQRLGYPQRAEADARDVVEREPRHAVAWFTLGVALEQQGRRAEAELAYRRSLALDPRLSAAASNLSNLLNEAGRHRDAETMLWRTLRVRPDDVGCWTALVIARYLRGDREGAREAIRLAADAGVRIDPELVGRVGELEGDGR